MYSNFKKELEEKSISSNTIPWNRVSCNLTEKVTAIGFSQIQDLLLVLTHSGNHIIDCNSGEEINYKSEADNDEIFDPYPIEISGFGRLKNEKINLGGIWGGGLKTFTSDGWSVVKLTLDFFYDTILLNPPKTRYFLDDLDDKIILLKNEYPQVRAYGFSNNGKFLAIATGEMLFLWKRHIT